MIDLVPAVPLMDAADDTVPATQTVRLDSELARKARIICAHKPGRAGKQTKLVDYLDSLLRAQIEGEYAETMARIASEQAGKEEGKRRGKKD